MKKRKYVIIGNGSLTLEEVLKVARNRTSKVKILPSAVNSINKSRAWVDRAISQGEVIYGITTGFGNFKDKTISGTDIHKLQTNLIRSHACGVGEPLREDEVRASILLRANSLSLGYSGVRLKLIEKLIELLNKNVYPYVPSQGSVGSSGDLAPLCHIMLTLMGEGECLNEGKRVPTIEVFKKNKIKPLQFEAKEGLALSNGTSVQTAILALAVYDAKQILNMSDLISALSVEVLMGSKKPFEKRLNEVRRQKGQISTAKKIFAILDKSPLVSSHKSCDRVQDAYSLRCIPQVHGACRDSFDHVLDILEREINAVTDNPIIFTNDNYAVSGGNFHGEPIAQAADLLKISMSEIANISERRTARMIDQNSSEGLPAFLVNTDKGGLHSGLMIPQYVAAALVSENKVLSHPASVDSIPTSANQEDHVSMGTIAARQAYSIVKNAKQVLAIELLNNTQAYEFRKPTKLSPVTEKLYLEVRKHVDPIVEDRPFYIDIEKIASIIGNYKYVY